MLKGLTAQHSEDWSGELLIEALWCRLGLTRHDSDVDIYQRRRCHVWGTPLFLGVMLLNVRGRTGTVYPYKVEGMLNMLYGEWSPQLAAFVVHSFKYVFLFEKLVHRPYFLANKCWDIRVNYIFHRCYKEYKNQGRVQTSSQHLSKPKSQLMSWMNSCSVNANITNANLFFITDPQGNFGSNFLNL